jgi:hypothetical protein
MKRTSAPLIIVLSLLVCGCSKRESRQAKQPNVDEPPVAQSEEPIKAATPEDPGPIATVVIPLEVLKKQAKSSQTVSPQEPLPIDHPVSIEAGEPKHFLHKLFSVNHHVQFEFLVPAHQGNTRLRGTFRSFTNRSDPDSTSDRSADVDVMVLNEEEFNQFLHGQPQSITYELDPSHNLRVDLRVPTTYTDPQKYHLVFSNADSGTKTKFVEADFTVSFE